MADTKETKDSTEQKENQQTQGRQPEQHSQSFRPRGREGERSRGLARRDPLGISPWHMNPFAMMNRYADEMERLFENFGFGGGFPRLWQEGLGETGGSAWSPEIEVYEREDQMVVRADLPGLTKDDVRIDVSDDALTIQGERKREHEERREGFYRSERSYGSFYRSIPLAEGVDTDNAKATFNNGVLEVLMPIREESRRRRRIDIGEGTRSEDQIRAGAKTSGK
jgi:HSP20 family protein